MYGENTIIGQIAAGNVPKTTVTNKVGKWVLKYPTGRDFQAIARKTAAALGGFPVDSFEVDYRFVAKRDAVLSIGIVEYPKDFPVSFQGDDISDYPDEEVKNSLYKEFNTFYSDTQKKISGKSEEDKGDKGLDSTS